MRQKLLAGIAVVFMVISFTNCSGGFSSGGSQLSGGGNQNASGTGPAPVPIVSPPTGGALYNKVYPVYTTCEDPATTYDRTVYVDPVNGADTNDGSQAHPWKTLNSIFYAKKILPGDHVVLLPGAHGAISVSQYNTPNLLNSPKWIWLDFKTGATADSITATGMNRWLVTGGEFNIGTGGWLANFAGNDIVFADNTLYGAQDSSGWTATQWLNAPSAINFRNVYCGSIVRNKVYNIRSGIFVSVDDPAANHIKSLVFSNNVRNFSADAMRPLGSDMLVENNTFLDGYLSAADGDANHDDIIQMYALNGHIFDNIVINKNYMQDSTDPTRPFQADYQGISCFDGLITNFQITNNVVLVGAYHGISMYGGSGVIGNNTVAPSKANGRSLWIGAFNMKDGTPPQNITIQNNVAQTLGGNATTGVTKTNNFEIKSPANDVILYDQANERFDMHLKSTSTAYGKGAGAL